MAGGKHRINEERLEFIAEILSGLGLHRILILEEEDPQYTAVGRVWRVQGAGPTAVLAVLNALVSYRLAMRGEDWWNCWADYHSQDRYESRLAVLASAELSFLENCRGSIVQREAKKRRVKLAAHNCRDTLETLLLKLNLLRESGLWLVRGLARGLKAGENAKTIVFSAKMAYYALRWEEGRVPAPGDVDIPVDVRVACFLYSTGIVNSESYRDLVRSPVIAQKAVRLISQLTGIPPLNLDTVFWLSGWAPRDLSLEEANIYIRRLLGLEGESLLFVRRCI